ncbi:MAG TPA: sugar ABC transporter substrate-binding protein [Micromonosporaceae bacterium]|nr:sugar ABC transporter substrate-binding protein [Micromonosporaceae bacterium]
MRPSLPRAGAIVALVLTVSVASACNRGDDGGGAGSNDDAFTIGYAGLSSEFPFVADVNRGLADASKNAGLTLITLDNKYDPQLALSNADTLVLRKSNVIIEFQTDAKIAPALCQKFEAAGLGKKVIAIDIPHPPCATFFGANNLLAGQVAGEELAKAAKDKWGSVDKLVLLELPQSGELVKQRTDGYIDGVKKVFPDFTDAKVVKVDGKGALEPSLTAMQNLLPTLAADKHVLLGAVNDPSAVGALRAIQSAGRQKDFLIGGQNATIEARQEICNNSETFIGTVGYFPERYGAKLVELAQKLNKGESVPENVYIEHQWINNKNIRDSYPSC